MITAFRVHLISSGFMLVGLLVMIGWIANIGVLQTPIPGGPVMKFATALSIFLGGFLLRIVFRQMSGTRLESSQVRAMIICFLFLLMIVPFVSSYLFDVNIGFDSIFDPVVINGMEDSSPTPSIGSVVSLLALFGISLGAAMGYAPQKYSGWGGAGLVMMGGIALVGYLTNQPELYFLVSHSSTGMAIHSAVSFFLIGVFFIVLSWKANSIAVDRRGVADENPA